MAISYHLWPFGIFFPFRMFGTKKSGIPESRKTLTRSAFFFLAMPRRQYNETAFRMWTESISRMLANWGQFMITIWADFVLGPMLRFKKISPKKFAFLTQNKAK
jgi:hypothetical protein